MLHPPPTRRRPSHQSRLLRWIWKEYRSIFGFLLGVWVTRSALLWSNSDLDEYRHGALVQPPPPGATLFRQQQPPSRTTKGLESRRGKQETFPSNVHPPQSLPKQSFQQASLKVQHKHKNVTYDPPYEVIRKQVDEGNMTAGQFALDFAIIGFPKCGTSTMMLWLGGHPEIQAIQKEVTTLQRNHPSQIVKQIYNHLQQGPYLRGYKSPNDVENVRAVNKLSDHYPHTKLIIGLRHPVRWLESFYNYRIQNGFDLPPFQDMQSTTCMGGMYGVCADRAQFQNNLVNFGKTNLNTTEELSNFSKKQQRTIAKQQKEGVVSKRLANPIFLYDTAQLGDKDNQTRLAQFQAGLSNFLGLNEALPPPLHQSPGKTITNQTEQALRNARKVHICDDMHKERRQQLIQAGKQTARWIRQYFLANPDVHVANPTHFDEIMDSYGNDPCDG